MTTSNTYENLANKNASCLQQEAELSRTVIVSGNKPEAIETTPKSEVVLSMVDNSSKSKANQGFSTTFTEAFTGADYKKGKDKDDNPRRPKDRSFAVTPETILYDKDLSDNAKLIYEAISRFTGDGKKARAGREYIGEKLGKSERTVDRGLAELEEKGLAIRTQRGNKGKRGRSVTYTKLKEPLHEKELEDFFWQSYPPEFYQRIDENESVFDIEDGEVKARLDLTLEDWDRDLFDKYGEQRLDLLDKYGEQPSGDKNSSQQGKDGEIDPLSREVKAVSREVNYINYSSLRSNDLFATVTSSQLKSKNPTNYNTPELIATLQKHALNADVVFKPNKLDGDHRNKVLGQVEDLKNNLGGPAEVVQFYEWYFKDPRRIQTFKDIERHKKVGVIVTKLDDYNSARDLKKIELRIELTGPTSQYTREDLQDLTLEKLEDLERDMREPVGESKQSMAEARAKMG